MGLKEQRSMVKYRSIFLKSNEAIVSLVFNFFSACAEFEISGISRGILVSRGALLLVSTKNRDLWPAPTTEVRDSRTSRHPAHDQS